MNKLILTIAIGKLYQEIALITHPFMHAYAARIGADFHVITKQLIARTTPHWEKFRIYDLLDQYDRIIYIDTDALVMPDCPNLFKIVPEYMVGAFDEGYYFDRPHPEYYNTGVMVVSKAHQDIFIKPEEEIGGINNFFEQNALNDLFKRNQTPMFSLSHKFNKMDFIIANGYIIHKAGNLNSIAELEELASNVMAQQAI